MSFLSLGSALKLIGGAPQQKVKSVFAEKLSLTKRLDGGAMSGLVKSVLGSGDLSTITQNPMAGLLGGLQGQIGALVGQLQGMGGGGSGGGSEGTGTGSGGSDPSLVVLALTGSGGLSEALAGLQASGNSLSGMTNGGAGPYALLGHATTVEMAAEAMPSQYGIAVASKPLACADALTQVGTDITLIVAQVLSGSLMPDLAAQDISDRTATVSAITQGSADALAWSEANHALIAAPAMLAGALAVPNIPEVAMTANERTLYTVLGSIVRPCARGIMDKAVAAQIAHVTHDPINVAALTSLEE